MLGYVTLSQQGETDRRLFAIAQDLRVSGLNLIGAVQDNIQRDKNRRCDMYLHLLPLGERIPISQHLGTDARGCRLDPQGLERAVGLTEAQLDTTADLLILNKFGKQECEGRGFRPLIAKALERGIPVLTGLSSDKAEAFRHFSGDMAVAVQPESDCVRQWLTALGA